MCGSKKSTPAQPTPVAATPVADPRQAGAAAQAASIQAAQQAEADAKAKAGGTEQKLGDQSATGIGALLTG